MLTAPFLRRVTLNEAKADRKVYPFNVVRYLAKDFELNFDSAITIIVGENGSGKSTLIEAIAQAAGFSAQGGSQDHRGAGMDADNALVPALRLSWLPKVSRGFFFRAESFFNYASYLEASGGFGNLHARSHGEAFLDTFQDRLSADRRAIYILDEPEVALSPQRQLAFLRILRQWQLSGQVQAIMATHSPILMNLPEASLLSLDGGAIRPVTPDQTEHMRIMKGFLANPVGVLTDLFADLG
jgi:predicted ATPase